MAKAKKKVAKATAKTKTVVQYVVDPALNDILRFYQDAANYGIKNGLIPVMVDGGEIARQYVITEEVEPKPVVNEVKAKRGRPAKGVAPADQKVISTPDKDDTSYLKSKGKKTPREENTNLETVTAKCTKCHVTREARRFETELTVMGEPIPFVCNSCTARR